jgi:hypothetical protein
VATNGRRRIRNFGPEADGVEYADGLARVLTAQSETQFQAAIMRTAKLFGWLAYHPWLSVKSAPGWPDVTLVKPGRMLMFEVKSEKGRLTTTQAAWLEILNTVPGITARCVRPSDWGDIVELLRA